jgi:hypothetical protein
LLLIVIYYVLLLFFKGGIFTLENDFKTREWSTFHIDDIDAMPVPFVMKQNESGISRITVPREKAKYQDIVIPVDVSMKENAGGKLLPFSTIAMKVVSPTEESLDTHMNKATVEMMPLPADSSSSSVGSQSTRSIFGPRNPMESYSFRGTKLSKHKLESLSRVDHHVNNNNYLSPVMDDDDLFSLRSFESKASHHSTNKKATETLNKSHHAISVVNPDWPAHQIHSRMMGWKLTSPERRKDLLHLLEHADLSTASMTEDELRQHRQTAGEKDFERIKQIAKRQTAAYEHSVR